MDRLFSPHRSDICAEFEEFAFSSGLQAHTIPRLFFLNLLLLAGLPASHSHGFSLLK